MDRFAPGLATIALAKAPATAGSLGAYFEVRTERYVVLLPVVHDEDI
jgi:hypothetical protein